VRIATPTAAGVVHTEFVRSLLASMGRVRQLGGIALFDSVETSDIVLGRNLLAARFLADAAATHLFFVDSDMAFGGDVCAKLLESGRKFVGCIYTKRQIDTGLLKKKLAETGGDLDDAMSLAIDFVVRTTGAPPQIGPDLYRVEGVGMGAAMIAREVFESMIASGAAPPVQNLRIYRQAGLTGPVHDFFGILRLPDGDALSEDFSFCRRWTDQCGGEVHALAVDDIGHVGKTRFAASYSRHLELKARARAAKVVVRMPKRPAPEPG
jgi:hypothetical protein